MGGVGWVVAWVGGNGWWWALSCLLPQGGGSVGPQAASRDRPTTIGRSRPPLPTVRVGQTAASLVDASPPTLCLLRAFVEHFADALGGWVRAWGISPGGSPARKAED